MSKFLIVNGVEFPAPARGFNFVVSTAVDTGKNADNAVIGEVIGRNQYKLDGMQWNGLPADIWDEMVAAVKPYFVPVTFENPEGKGTITITMYPGDRKAEPYWLNPDGTVKMYKNCQFNLIDTGWE